MVVGGSALDAGYWARNLRAPVQLWAALQALPAGATLPFKSGGKDRANGHAGR